MARKKSHFIAYSICPMCSSPARVRRDGRIKHHRIPIWDDATQSGRFLRCPGTGEKNNVEMAWKTYEDAERGLVALRKTTKTNLPEDAAEEETAAPGEEVQS